MNSVLHCPFSSYFPYRNGKALCSQCSGIERSSRLYASIAYLRFTSVLINRVLSSTEHEGKKELSVVEERPIASISVNID